MRNRSNLYLWISLTLILLIPNTPGRAAIDPADVLVLYNVDSTEGTQIANYYQSVYPDVTLLGLTGVSTAEEVGQDHYLNVIRPQIIAGLTATSQVIVTTKGLPLRINNSTTNPGSYPGSRAETLGLNIPNGSWKTYSSLESELTRIDTIDSQQMMGDQYYLLSPPAFAFPTLHHAANPYFDSGVAFDRADADNEGIRLTARLDGFTVADVTAAIDRAQQAYILPSRQYVIVDDDPDAPAASVDKMPQLAGTVLPSHSQSLVYNTDDTNVTDADKPIIGYVSHGSHAAGAGYINSLDFDIAAGAVFHTWESYNAYSFTDGGNIGGQALIGDWLELGATAGLGHVEEPTASASAVANEDIFFDMLLNGHTFVEAAWAATLQLSYVNTVVGDPLMTLDPWVTGDFDLDGQIDVDDLNILLANWGQNVGSAGMTEGDPDFDGQINQDDLNVLLAAGPGAGTVIDVLYNLNPPVSFISPGTEPSTPGSTPAPGTFTIFWLGTFVVLRRGSHITHRLTPSAHGRAPG